MESRPSNQDSLYIDNEDTFLFSDVPIDYNIQGGESTGFSLNTYLIENMSIVPEETGCAGRFYDK